MSTKLTVWVTRGGYFAFAAGYRRPRLVRKQGTLAAIFAAMAHAVRR